MTTPGKTYFQSLWGGQARPPFSKRLARSLPAVCLGLALVCLTVRTTLFAHSQGRLPAYRLNHQEPPANVQQDPAAIALLRKIVRPTANFVGEQVTERSNVTSHQQVEGDTLGHLRLDFHEPPRLEGDVMLIAPNQFRNYHKRTNTVDIALWPTGPRGAEGERRVLNQLQHNRLVATRMGQETIAGRSADIVEVGPPPGRPGFAFKFWIDSDTGIKLKQEVTGPRGSLVYRSYFTHITVGPDANVAKQDFEPSFLQTAKPNPLFPPGAQEFDSIAAARPQLPFTPLEPSDLPMGFRLAHVWVFPARNLKTGNAAAMLRYSDGLAHFNLYERLLGPNAKALPRNPQRAGKRSVQRWRFAASNGSEMEVIYIGLLSPDQIRTIHDSLR